MDTLNKALIPTFELILDEWRWTLNAVYARQACADGPEDRHLFEMLQREIDRRVAAIKKMESLILALKETKP